MIIASMFSKLLNFLVLFIMSGPTAFGDKANSIVIKKLSDKIYVAESRYYYPENSAFYVGEQGVTVISATWTPETAKALVDEVRKITDKPITAVVNTHHHFDRVGGNPYFSEIGAEIIASKKTYELMKRKWVSSNESLQKYYPKFPTISFVEPKTLFADQMNLEKGKIRIRYFGPSHTEDGAVVYFPEEKILFGGCIVKERLGNLDDANVSEYPKTLERIKKLEIKTIIAGHWTSIHGPELIDQMLDLLKRREAKKVARKSL